MKYQNEHDEFVHQYTLDGSVPESGDAQASTGWFAEVTLDDSTGSEDAARVAHYGSPWLIVREDSDGNVVVLHFDTIEARRQAFARLDLAYSLWSAGIQDDEAITAISGYQEAAVFTEELEAQEYAWSVAAQESIRTDVIGFITANADDCREFMDVTKHEWTQIGIDFWLTRNGHGAGFWDRGAGASGDRLTEAAHPYGTSNVFVSDAGELEVL